MADLDRVVSGGQTGTDQAGLCAAKVSVIVTGGWIPEAFLTEAGPRPDFAEIFGALEMLACGQFRVARCQRPRLRIAASLPRLSRLGSGRVFPGFRV